MTISHLARRVATTVGALLTTVALVACQGESADPSASAEASASEPPATAQTSESAAPASESAPAPGGFQPITIQHALGTTEITEKPERVVTLGQGSAEIAISLGVIPVAMETQTVGVDDSGYLPWIHEAITERGGDLPEFLGEGDSLSADKIKAAEPDLILAPWSGITQEQYDQFSAIAPTVAYAQEPWLITWQEHIEVVCQALGEANQAPVLIQEVGDYLASQRNADYEQYKFSYLYANGPDDLGVYFPSDQRVAMISGLGLSVDPVVEEFRDPEAGLTNLTSISRGDLDKLNSPDVIFTFYPSEDVREHMAKDSAFSKIKAIENGAEVAPGDPALALAASIVTPLTVTWAVPRMKELIDQAVSKVK